MAYEYQHVVDPSDKALTKLGAKGWRVISVMNVSDGAQQYLVIYMERAYVAKGKHLPD